MKKGLKTIGILAGVLIVVPIIGYLLFMFIIMTDHNTEERKSANKVEDYLEKKYNIPFHVKYEYTQFVGSTIAANPINNSGLTFLVKKNRQGKYVDHFLDALYKEDIDSAIERHLSWQSDEAPVEKKEIDPALEHHPNLKDNDTVRVMVYFDPNASVGKKFDFSEGYPDLIDIPIPLTIKVNSDQKREIYRGAVFEYLHTTMSMIQEENLPNEQVTSTIMVDAGDVVHYYTYKIPRESYNRFTSVVDLKKYEKVKSVKRQ
ncbi:hypothetical protein [Pseudalkalibacillus berkeleyi]|uniref:Uncharacterized protein n=1 Tax=Pseudalkalibacillus berkeleyi TaxID=1069813 RepID=A0ABS9H1H1_9BACL|nr:hypothetical protein [Pseudalkalibacillus berkeleyi]MCF6138844.1 hypothetical protein [Pseudalkalibacillus berkeleyi]